MKIRISTHPGVWLSILFLLVSVAALAGSVWFSLDQNISFRDIKDRLATIESQALRVDTLESRWSSVVGEAETIETAFVRRDQLAVFLETIEATAAAAGISEQTTIFNEKDDEITLKLRVSGPFEGVYTFVTHLNVLPNLLFVERVDFFQGAIAAPSNATPAQVAGHSSAEVVVRIPLQINK